MGKPERWTKGMDESWIRLVKLFELYYPFTKYGDRLDNVAEPQQVLVLIYVFRGEVNNGGLDQYFTNSYGNNTHETLEALKIIGAVKTAAFLQEAMEAWPEGKVPKSQTERLKVMNSIDTQAEPIWDTCTRRIYKGEESILHLLYTYLDTHANEFKPEN